MGMSRMPGERTIPRTHRCDYARPCRNSCWPRVRGLLRPWRLRRGDTRCSKQFHWTAHPGGWGDKVRWAQWGRCTQQVRAGRSNMGEEPFSVEELRPVEVRGTERLDLSRSQAETLRGILQAACPSLLWVLDSGTSLSRDVAEAVVDVLSGEFSANGLRPDDEPNAWGLEVEEILTAVNRCNFE